MDIDIDLQEYPAGYSDEHINSEDAKLSSLLQCGICYLILRDPHHLVSIMSFFNLLCRL